MLTVSETCSIAISLHLCCTSKNNNKSDTYVLQIKNSDKYHHDQHVR